MENVIYYMEFLEYLFGGVKEAFSDTDPLIQFEQIFIIGALLFLALLIINATTIVKLVYSIIKKKKGISSVNPMPTYQDSSVQTSEIPFGTTGTIPLTSSNIQNSFTPGQSKTVGFKSRLKQIFIDVKSAIKCLFGFFLKPFNIRDFAKKAGTKKEIGFAKFKIRIPFLVILGIKVIILNVMIIFSLTTFFKKYFLTYPDIVSIYPEKDAYWDDYERPIEIEFSTPLDKDSLIINMAPEAQGSWEFEKSFSFLPFTRKLKFYPAETIFPGEKVMVYLTDLTNHLHTQNPGEHLIEFNSIHLPIIESVTPENESVNVPIDQEILLKLNQKDGPYVEWEFILDKENTYQIIRDNSKTIKLDFDAPLAQGETYKFEIYQTPLSFNLETEEVTKKGEKELVYTLEFTTVPVPLISEMSPTGSGVLIDQVIRVVFDNEMDKESVEKAFTITPETEGEITWEDDKTFVFTPAQPLPKETHYDIVFTKGIVSKVGGITESDITFSFDTIGAVKVQGWSPGPGASGVKINSSIYVTFDQQVDHASAQSHFSISPSVEGTFSWNGNTLIFSHSSPFGYSTTYTVTISAGIKTINGLDSRSNFSTSFTTESNVFILNVPLHRQTHAFLCNVTAVSMVIAYKGVPSSEMSVYNEIAKDNTPCTKDGDRITVWGNPHAGYVGDIDGAGYCGGYGVYWGASSAYISSKGISNRVFTGWNVAALAQEVEQGHPAVIWWQNGWSSPYDKSWHTPGGQYIYAINGMHSEVVIGFIGPSSNPTHIITNDPWRGRRTISVGSFNSLWGIFNRTAVVVY